MWLLVKPFLMTIFGWISTVFSFLARIIIPIPLLLILAVASLWYFERDSYAVQYAENQIKDLIAGAELEALQRDLELNQKINQRWREIHEEELRRVKELEQINAEFEQREQETTKTIDDLNKLLEKANESDGEDKSGPISDEFFNSLRDK